MTKNLNCKRNTKIKTKNKKIKRLRYNFTKKYKNTNKIHAKTLTTNDTQKEKNKVNIINKSNLNINIELIKENIKNYSTNLSKNHFEKYGIDILTNSLINESIINKSAITEETLYKYNLTKENRKNAFKYLLNFIEYHNINIKYYFSAALMFDLFLINYSKELDNNCETFFFSKKTNELSGTKIILLLLCCFYITSKYYNKKIITVEHLLKFENAKDEFTYDNIIDLIDDIIIYTDINICNINIYYYIKIYMFDILMHLKGLTQNQKFLEDFENYTTYFSTRIIQDINIINIMDNIQALGIVIFSFKLSKYICAETDVNLDNYLKTWTENISNITNNYDINGLSNIIQWLNIYVSK